MPMIGFGTTRLVEAQILGAIEAGARHIDCARLYGNERGVGNAIKRSGVPRSEFFVTTKVWNDAHRPELAKASILASLQDLQLDYVDLALIHWPNAWKPGTVLVPDSSVNHAKTWAALAELVKEKKIRSLGVSNFDQAQLEVLFQAIETNNYPPCCVNQIECHPFFQNTSVLNFCKAQGIHIVAWSPLAKAKASLASDHRLFTIARMRNCTVYDVVLRWHLDRGVIVIPKSSKPENVKRNLDVLKMKPLADHDHTLITQCHTGYRRAPDLIAIWPSTAHPLVRWILAPLIVTIMRIVLLVFRPIFGPVDLVAIAQRSAQKRELKFAAAASK